MSSPTNKTPGPDGFSNEYYKLLVLKQVRTLTTPYNDIYQHQNPAELFLNSRTTQILKLNKGSTVPQSYRPIPF